MEIPTDFPVKVLGPNDPAKDRVTCGSCGRSWDDAIPTQWTPAPSARCPFEYFHEDDDEHAGRMSVEVSAEQLKVIEEALGDAYAYRTDSGEQPEEDLEDHEREACLRYQRLADQLGLTIE